MGRVTTVTSKGQVTIPKEVRDQLGIRPHDKIHFSVEDGCARLKRYPRLDEVVGRFPSLASLGLDLTVEEVIELAMEDHAIEVAEKMARE